MIMLPPKAPGEVLRYAIDWSDALVDGETVSSQSVVVTGAVLDSSNLSDAVVTIAVSGGLAGSVARIVATMTASNGETFERLLLIPVSEMGQAIVTDREARLSLRLGPAGEDVDDDADLARVIAQAQAVFLTYNGPIPEAWIDDTVSPHIVVAPDEAKAAVLTIIHSLWDERGADPTSKAYPLMRLIRGPALA